MSALGTSRRCAVACLALALAARATAQDPAELTPLATRVDEAIRAAAEWLIANQSESGAFGSHHSPRPIEIFATVPGSHDAFRIGTTGLGVSSLQDFVRTRGPDGRGERALAAIDRGIDYLLDNFDVKRVDGTEHYNVWAFGYGLRAFGEHVLQFPEDPRNGRIRAACERLVSKLGQYQDLDGGWGYLSLSGVRTYQPSFTSMSFTTATILVGLDRAMRAGVDVPERLLERALESVERCRTPTGSYTYGKLWNTRPVAGINVAKGAACRTPACQYALDLFGREVAEEDHRRSLEDLLVKHARFQVMSLRRPIPHESWYQVSGYFYLYGHAYAANVLEGLGAEDQRRFGPTLARAVLVCRQPDGSFWDYPMYSYHKPYGTAFALIALTRVALEE